MEALLIAAGVPSAICGLLVWWLKRYIDKREKAREEHDKNMQDLMMMIMQTGRANNVLAVATAKEEGMSVSHCRPNISTSSTMIGM